MIIQIHSSEKNRNIVLPNGFALNWVTAIIGAHYINKENKGKQKRISSSDLRKLFSEIKRYKKENSDWNLVEVESASGENVIIRL